jgi:hypothetical protein
MLSCHDHSRRSLRIAQDQLRRHTPRAGSKGDAMCSATSFATALLRRILLWCLGMAGVGFATCASANLISPVVIIDNALVFSATVDITQFSVDL